MSATTTTITINASKYADHDDCLSAAESDAREQYGLDGYDLSPRWADDSRDEIVLTLPAWAIDSDESEDDGDECTGRDAQDIARRVLASRSARDWREAGYATALDAARVLVGTPGMGQYALHERAAEIVAEAIEGDSDDGQSDEPEATEAETTEAASTSTYRISYTDGRTESHDSLEAAKDAIIAEYTDAEIGHDGDLDEGGERTLAWATEADSIDDDGAKAIASIRQID